MKNLRNLDAHFDSRKSFYGKAKTEVTPDKVILYSYGTAVSVYDLNTNELEHLGKWSMTTSRHQREFEAQIDDIKDLYRQGIYKDLTQTLRNLF